jgi:CBS domain-containing protein
VLLMIGVFVLLAGYIIDGVWMLFIGWFLLNAAKAEAQNMQLESILGKLRARDVMHSEFETVRPGLSLQEVVDDHMLARGERAVVVSHGDGVLGILTVGDVRRVPRDEWASTPVQGVMTPRDKVTTVAAETKAIDVLRLVSEKRLHQIPVLADGRMVGMVTRRELLDRLQLAESLAPDLPPAQELKT